MARTRRAKKRRLQRPGFAPSWSSLFKILLIVSCALGGWLLWLDHNIQVKFEGRRWALPARVFASPRELFVGQDLSVTEFENEIQSLGYIPGTHLRPGVYRRNGKTIHIVRRPFVFWDGNEPGVHFELQFHDSKLAALINHASGKRDAIFRLEPLLIGKIFPQHNEDRLIVPYREVPPFLTTALVAVEDRKFFSHSGVDIRGILRAFLVNLQAGSIRQGGSTLTQQLVKNFFLSAERTYWRKFNELLMSVMLERRYTKADILAAYINEIYLGQHGARGIHGFATAAEYYFSRPLSELSKDQIALLVGMVKGASYYNPFRHPQRALKRRNLVLRQMGELGYADEMDMKNARSQPLGLAAKPNWGGARYPAFMDLVKRQLLKDYRLEDLRSEGLRIFTTLEPHIQERIETVAEGKVSEIEHGRNLSKGALEYAAVVQHVSSGEILGLIGGRDRDDTGFNRALDAYRPVGSLLKPVVYYAALSRPEQFNVLTMLDDSAVSIRGARGENWEPKNYDRKTHGRVPMFEALANSYNLATVNLGMDIGVERIAGIVRDLGIDKPVKPYPSLLLGALDLSPMQVSNIYQAFANGGFQVYGTAIREVMTREGNPLHRYPLELEQILEPGPVFLTNFLLQQVTLRGTARSLRDIFSKDSSLAGKTGTTNGLRDSWFAGFGDNLMAVVWLGKDDNSPSGLTGASGAMQIWADIMNEAGLVGLHTVSPLNIDWLAADAASCKGLREIPYIRGFKPERTDCFDANHD